MVGSWTKRDTPQVLLIESSSPSAAVCRPTNECRALLAAVYHPILRRLETFTDDPLRNAIKDHEKRAGMVLDLEERVAGVVKKLKERGLVSSYLRSFVVARINPLRWIKGEPPALEEVLKTMRERAGKFNVEKIRPQDLAGAGGPPDDEA